MGVLGGTQVRPTRQESFLSSFAPAPGTAVSATAKTYIGGRGWGKGTPLAE